MKILHIITNTELGGAQKVCADLCACQIRDGNSVAVCSMAGGFLWNALPSSVVQIQLKNLVKEISPLKDLKAFFEISAAIKKFSPHIIQLHSSKAGVLGRAAAFGSGAKVCYTVHGFDSIRLSHKIFLPLEKILQNFCSAIVAVSFYDEKNLRAEKIRRNVVTIYNGISSEPVQYEKKFPFETSGKKIILSVARISAPKKIGTFLNVAKLFDAQKFLFVWIGGDGKHSAEELEKIYDVPENVVLMGDVQNASRFMKLCDVFVLFSNFEGLPMTIIEAMAAKKSVVASNVGGIGELVDETNGALTENLADENLEAEDAAKKIMRILSDENLKKSMEENSYGKFCEKFTLEKMYEGYKKIYEKILNENQHSRRKS